MFKVLRKDSTGYFVVQWQTFLRGQGFLVEANGTFDANTVLATKSFQEKYQLDADGVVGNQTLGKAALLGFEIVEYSETESDYPAKPTFPPLVGNNARQALFGPLQFEPAPTAGNPENIRITNEWDKNNLVKVIIPQLSGVAGANADGHLYFHRLAAKQLVALWKAWEERGLLADVLTFDGAYAPRFVRGEADKQLLSNHAFATAFDINYAWNKLGAEPATSGSKGCVYKLVAVAHEFGFYWGGHFTRRDGMHFEVAKIMP